MTILLAVFTILAVPGEVVLLILAAREGKRTAALADAAEADES